MSAAAASIGGGVVAAHDHLVGHDDAHHLLGLRHRRRLGGHGVLLEGDHGGRGHRGLLRGHRVHLLAGQGPVPADFSKNCGAVFRSV